MPKPDGRLTDDLDPSDRPPRDACGVFGVWSPGEDVAKLAYYGLYALQHRGQESAGIAVSDGDRIVVYKDMGLVAQVFDEAALNYPARVHRGRPLPLLHLGLFGVGERPADLPLHPGRRPGPRAQRQPDQHAGTGPAAGRRSRARAPAARGDVRHRRADRAVRPPAAVARPGRAAARRRFRPPEADDGRERGTGRRADDIEEMALATLPLVRGAYSLVFMNERTLYAARDPQGFRPLVLGQLATGWAVASETAALEIIGASFVREIEPGELITIDERGVRSRTFAPAQPKGCLFEYVYLARPDTTIAGRNVQATRVEVGRKLAAEHPADADLVIPVPESGTPAAIGYAEASGIPYGQGLVKNSYVGRTFIQPSQTIRQRGYPAEAEPAGRSRRRAAPGRRGRFDRPREHPARDRGDAARGGRGRGARADLQPAGQLALLLRDRLRDPGRADRGPRIGGRRSAPRSALTHSATSRWTA